MNEREINTTFQNRQRFKFICPPERTVEARLLLNQIDGVRLVPENPNAPVQVRVHIFAGATEGFEISGVAASHELSQDALCTLSENGIAGFDRKTQITLVKAPRTKEEFEKRDLHETHIDFERGIVSFGWNATDSPDETFSYQEVVTFKIGNSAEDFKRVLGKLISNKRQWNYLLSGLEVKVDHELAPEKRETLNSLLEKLRDAENTGR